MEQASFHCPSCNQRRLFTRKGTNHILHLLLTLFLCLLWAPVWIIVTISEGSSPYFCSQCGYGDQPQYLQDPSLRQRVQSSRNSYQLQDASEMQDSSRWKIPAIAAGGTLFIVVALLAYSFAPSRSMPSINKPVITETEKKYLTSSLNYLSSLKNLDEKAAITMAGASNGQSSLLDIKKALEDARTQENSSFNSYSGVFAPAGYGDLDKKVKEIHERHGDAFDEYLRYFKDKRLQHINQGSEKFKRALLLTSDTIKEFTARMEEKN